MWLLITVESHNYLSVLLQIAQCESSLPQLEYLPVLKNYLHEVIAKLRLFSRGFNKIQQNSADISYFWVAKDSRAERDQLPLCLNSRSQKLPIFCSFLSLSHICLHLPWYHAFLCALAWLAKHISGTLTLSLPG